jgi:hypothetical protein
MPTARVIGQGYGFSFLSPWLIVAEGSQQLFATHAARAVEGQEWPTKP